VLNLTQVRLSQDGNLMATVGGTADPVISAGDVHLWYMPGGKDHLSPAAERLLVGHTKPILHLLLSPDGRTLVTTSADQAVRLWDTLTAQEWAVLRGHAAAITFAGFGPEGRLLITGDAGGTLRLWEVATAKERAVLPGDALKWVPVDREREDRTVQAAAVTPDGKSVA
jgi:WD40 repeat protein